MCVSAYNNCSTDAGLFTCRSGQCVHAAVACDGRSHCDDGSVPAHRVAATWNSGG